MAERGAQGVPGGRGGLDRLHVFLVRPTKYDDEGYLVRHFRGVLPSNTLACLHGLTEDLRHRGALGNVHLEVELCDESVQAFPWRRLRRVLRRRRTRVVVALVGVQTSQMPRAVVLTRRLQTAGASVLVGGFHVSGRLIDGEVEAPELVAIRDVGATLVCGEVEGIWENILRDAMAGDLQAVYADTGPKPDLSHAPVPRLERQLAARFVYRHFGTLETSRGCPFACSFCTIIHVQGRRMRARDPEGVIEALEENHRRLGTRHYFFTDDDLARNPRWPEFFEGLIRLREDRGIDLRFLMQADLLAHRQKHFVDLARRAGCFQVFMGLESLDASSLRAAGKRQNRVGEYAATLRTWHDAGILTHVGYIIGFPEDTPASVAMAVRALKHDLAVDLASFFLLTPLPGSDDYRRARAAGDDLDTDLGRFDTFHPVIDHPRMTRLQWSAAYQEAWRSFYSFEHRLRRLSAHRGERRATLAQVYLWYLSALQVDRFHPMMTGVGRCRPRRDRAPGVPIESLSRHFRRRSAEIVRDLCSSAAVLSESRRLWAEAADPPSSVGWGDYLRAMFTESGTLPE